MRVKFRVKIRWISNNYLYLSWQVAYPVKRLMPICQYFSSIPNDIHPMFLADVIMCIRWNMFDLWVNIKSAVDVQNAFCIVHYTYFMVWSLFRGLNVPCYSETDMFGLTIQLLQICWLLKTKLFFYQERNSLVLSSLITKTILFNSFKKLLFQY